MTNVEFVEKLRLYQGLYPKQTRKALSCVAAVARKEGRKQLSGGTIGRDKGDLYNALRTKIGTNPFSVATFIKKEQQYKAQTHEYGLALNPRARKKEAWGGNYLLINKKGIFARVKSIKMPQRPFMENTKAAVVPQMRDFLGAFMAGEAKKCLK